MADEKEKKKCPDVLPWDAVRDVDRPNGDFVMNVYLDAPQPMPTGVDKLDELLGGGIVRGVTVIGGPSSCGKSVLACQCAAAMAARGQKVVYASYEMGWDVVHLRCASAWSVNAEGVENFSWSSVVNGYYRNNRPQYIGKSRGELSRYLVGDAMDPITRALTMWDEGPGRSLAVLTSGNDVDMLLDSMRALRSQRPVLIVDYIQIVPVKTEKRDMGEYERVTRVMQSLQSYAMGEGGGPVIAISSTRNLSQQDYKDGPNLGWFRGSGYIGYSAEQAVMLVPEREKGSDGRIHISRNADKTVNGLMYAVKNKAGSCGEPVKTKLYGWSNYIL